MTDNTVRTMDMAPDLITRAELVSAINTIDSQCLGAIRRDERQYNRLATVRSALEVALINLDEDCKLAYGYDMWVAGLKTAAQEVQ